MPETRYFELPAGPCQAAAAVTPNDGADLTPPTTAYPTPTRALLIGVAGTISVDMGIFGTAVSMTVPAGLLPLSVKRVRATGTTATGIVALW